MTSDGPQSELKSDIEPAAPTPVDLRRHAASVFALVSAAQRTAHDLNAGEGPRERFVKRLRYRGGFTCFDNIIADFIDRDLTADSLPADVLGVCEELDIVQNYPERLPAMDRYNKSLDLLAQLAQILIDLAGI